LGIPEFLSSPSGHSVTLIEFGGDGCRFLMQYPPSNSINVTEFTSRHRNGSSFLADGTVLGFLGVVFGAFGAHALRDGFSPEMLGVIAGVQRTPAGEIRVLFLIGWHASQFLRASDSGFFSAAS
jgi:hypothetical protein